LVASFWTNFYLGIPFLGQIDVWPFHFGQVGIWSYHSGQNFYLVIILGQIDVWSFHFGLVDIWSYHFLVFGCTVLKIDISCLVVSFGDLFGRTFLVKLIFGCTIPGQVLYFIFGRTIW
tara:strand:- start:235 stop:588 length:354 start_codon:yes stop_codon:yes gene_type:complete